MQLYHRAHEQQLFQSWPHEWSYSGSALRVVSRLFPHSFHLGDSHNHCGSYHFQFNILTDQIPACRNRLSHRPRDKVTSYSPWKLCRSLLLQCEWVFMRPGPGRGGIGGISCCKYSISFKYKYNYIFTYTTYIYIYTHTKYVYVYTAIDRRKFTSQTSDNMERWKSRGGKSQGVGRVREEKSRSEKVREEKDWEARRCRCAKR